MGAPILDDGKLCQSLNIYLDSDTTIEFSLSYEEPTPKPDRPAEEPSRKVQLKVRQSEGTPRTGGDVVKPFNLDD